MNVNLTSSGGGLGQISNILDLIKNESAYTKKVNELTTLITTNEKAANKITKAKNIDEALRKARESKEKAEDFLEKAEAKAEEIVTKASYEVNELVSAADDHILKMDKDLTDARIELSGINSKIMTAKNELDTIAEEITKASGTAEGIILQAQQTKREYEGKLQELKNRIKDI